LACGLIDNITMAVDSEEKARNIPTDLLAKYAFVLCAAGMYMDYDDPIRQIAQVVVAATFPRPPAPKSRTGKKALSALPYDWLYCIQADVEALIADMTVQTGIIAAALLESGELAADDISQLLSRVCYGCNPA